MNFLQLFLFPPTQISGTRFAQSLHNKTLFITGASFGIGEAIARQCALPDTRLILTARTADKLNLLKSELEQTGCQVDIFAADLRKREDVDALISFLLPQQIDIVVSNAGKSIRRSIFDSLDRYHDFSRTMDVNYHAPVRLMLKLIPQLLKQKGQIINISTVNALLPPAPYWAAYQASKTAFDQWLGSIAPALRREKIAVSTLYLPLVKTRMIAPTKLYEGVPAMTPEQVAQIACKRMIDRRRSFKPWWLRVSRPFIWLFRGYWEKFTIKMMKKNDRLAS